MGSYSISLIVKNALLREGLCRILSESDFSIQQSTDEIDGIKFEFDHEDHIVIIEHNLTGISSEKESLLIINRFHKSKSVILADKFELELTTKFFAAGARAYILSDVPYKTFLIMMQLVSLGENVVPSQFIASVNNWNFREREFPHGNSTYRHLNLTERDVKILGRLSLGLSNKMISRELGVSEATVKVSVKNIFRKLSVSNRTQAAIMAHEINDSPDHGLSNSE